MPAILVIMHGNGVRLLSVKPLFHVHSLASFYTNAIAAILRLSCQFVKSVLIYYCNNVCLVARSVDLYIALDYFLLAEALRQ